MSQTFHFATVATLASLTTACPALAQTNEGFARARLTLMTAVQSGHVGSAVGLIARGGKVMFLEAVGMAGPDVPMMPDAIVRLSSITKPITATAIMILVEEGKLSLTDSVNRFFPQFGHRVLGDRAAGQDSTVPAVRPVTVFDLLTHQSGISTDDSEFDRLWTQARTAQEFSAMLGTFPLRFQPGTRFHYGFMGSSYEVLAGIVERVTGETFAAFVDRRIIQPLQMRDTWFTVPSDKRSRLAAQYRQESSGTLTRFRELGQEEPTTSFFSGGGGLRSTVLDYFRFAQFLLNRGELEGVRLLKSETVRQMLTNQVASGYPTAGFGWGFGVQVRTEPGSGAEHEGNFGWNGGTGTLFLVDPIEQMIVVIFAPSTPRSSGVNQLRQEFVGAAYGR